MELVEDLTSLIVKVVIIQELVGQDMEAMGLTTHYASRVSNFFSLFYIAFPTALLRNLQ
jgi:hypothetical protein